MTDVLITPGLGQIQFTDSSGTPQTTKIVGNLLNEIVFVGDTVSGGSPSGALVTITDSTTGTLTPGQSGYGLGTSSLRWSVFATNLDVSGTLTFPAQTANKVLAGPTSGAPGASTFRSLVTADFPASGVSAASYINPYITVDSTGRITSATGASGSSQGQVPHWDTAANGGAGGIVFDSNILSLGTNGQFYGFTVGSGQFVGPGASSTLAGQTMQFALNGYMNLGGIRMSGSDGNANNFIQTNGDFGLATKGGNIYLKGNNEYVVGGGPGVTVLGSNNNVGIQTNNPQQGLDINCVVALRGTTILYDAGGNICGYKGGGSSGITGTNPYDIWECSPSGDIHLAAHWSSGVSDLQIGASVITFRKPLQGVYNASDGTAGFTSTTNGTTAGTDPKTGITVVGGIVTGLPSVNLTTRGVQMSVVQGLLMGSLTPSTNDTVNVPVPYSPVDGQTSVTWTIERVDFRCETTPVGGPATANVNLNGTGILSSVLSIPAGSNATFSNTFSTITCKSGDLFQLAIGTINSSDIWSIYVLLKGSF